MIAGIILFLIVLGILQAFRTPVDLPNNSAVDLPNITPILHPLNELFQQPDCQEIIERHRTRIEIDKSLESLNDEEIRNELDQALIDLDQAWKNRTESDIEWYARADRFIWLAMKLSSKEQAITYVRVALAEYNLPFQPTQMASFGEFHRLYSKTILLSASGTNL